jgi:hypothetical protein
MVPRTVALTSPLKIGLGVEGQFRNLRKSHVERSFEMQQQSNSASAQSMCAVRLRGRLPGSNLVPDSVVPSIYLR